jgi:hypothetical protein
MQTRGSTTRLALAYPYIYRCFRRREPAPAAAVPPAALPIAALYRDELRSISVSGARPCRSASAALAKITCYEAIMADRKATRSRAGKKAPYRRVLNFHKSKAGSLPMWKLSLSTEYHAVDIRFETKLRSPSPLSRAFKSRLYWLTGKPEITNHSKDGGLFLANTEKRKAPSANLGPLNS